MPRIKDRNRWLPYGWQLLLPEIGMKEPISGSFYDVVDAFAKIVNKNPALAQKNNWPTDTKGQENFIDQREVHRMLQHGWTEFVLMDAPEQAYAWSEKKTSFLSGIAAGTKILAEWLGEDGKPVDHELAEKRASICATCPANSGGNWLSYFTKPIADRIRYMMGVRHDLQLNTSYDKMLTVCDRCHCELKTKVHVPLKHINSYMSAESKAALEPRCWILHE